MISCKIFNIIYVEKWIFNIVTSLSNFISCHSLSFKRCYRGVQSSFMASHLVGSFSSRACLHCVCILHNKRHFLRMLSLVCGWLLRYIFNIANMGMKIGKFLLLPIEAHGWFSIKKIISRHIYRLWGRLCRYYRAKNKILPLILFLLLLLLLSFWNKEYV